LAERKVAFFSDTSDKLQDLGHKIELLKLVKDQPSVYINNYFDDLRKEIDLKSQQAKDKIEKERQDMKELLKEYEEKSLKNLEKSGVQKIEMDSNIENLIKTYEGKSVDWNQSLGKKALSEKDIKNTKTESTSFDRLAKTELTKTNLKLFNDKVYELKSHDVDSIQFAYLVSFTSNDLLDKHNKLKSAALNDEVSLRPMNRLMRFEIKSNRKRSIFL
jgi:hypothetical protein